MKIDAEKGEGVKLADRYNISGYPTTVFLKPDGTEIDRIVGYLPTEKFLAEIQRIQQGSNTYLSLEKAVREDPDDVGTLLSFARKVESRGGEGSRALRLWQRVDSLSAPQAGADTLARFKIAEYRSTNSNRPGPLRDFLEEHPGSAFQVEARRALIRIYRKLGETDEEAEMYQEMIELAEETGEINPGMLNSYAWRMAELDLHLQDAFARAEQAVDLSSESSAKSRAQILDTKAEVLWKLGDTTRAVEVIEQCIQLQPDDEYYQEQRAKFLGNAAG